MTQSSSANPQLSNILNKINELSDRERVMVITTVSIVITLLFFQLMHFPMYESWNVKKADAEFIANSKEQLRVSIEALQEAAETDPNAPMNREIYRMRKKLEQLEGRITDITGTLISPENMTLVLAQLLDRRHKIKINSITTLPSVPIDISVDGDVVNDEDTATAESPLDKTAPPVNSLSDAEPMLYQHTIELELEGRYVDILDYLMSIESLPEKLFWDQLNITIKSYPISTIKLRVHTLTNESATVGV